MCFTLTFKSLPPAPSRRSRNLHSLQIDKLEAGVAIYAWFEQRRLAILQRSARGTATAARMRQRAAADAAAAHRGSERVKPVTEARRTESVAFTSAPSSTSSLNTASWPKFAAQCSAVKRACAHAEHGRVARHPTAGADASAQQRVSPNSGPAHAVGSACGRSSGGCCGLRRDARAVGCAAVAADCATRDAP